MFEILGSFSPVFLGLVSLIGLAAFTVGSAFLFRRVVPTNEVHIVQSGKSTTSYGKDMGHGNVYYEWPSFLPFFGITKVVLPVSNFDVDLTNYEAYDVGRLPFVADVKAFFRIHDSNVAAQRVASFKELHDQLKAIVQGAVRTILASSEIQEIMQGRSKFGEMFTSEVSAQLANWGVVAVKNIELMDIRDHSSSNVINNIMAKKKSHIEMETRTEVAKNSRIAKIAEIEAQQQVDLQSQEALQNVGLRTIQTQKEVALQNEAKTQAVKEQERLTKEKEMEVLSVQHVRTAEINKNVNVVQAKQAKEVAILTAEGQLETKRKEAEGITLEGQAKADAEKAMQLAPVQAQITLAKEIGTNKEYQEYLVTIRKIEAAQAIGERQATALSEADVKIIANTGEPSQGLTNVMDLFTSKGGTSIASMLEALTQGEKGAEVVNAFIPKK